METSQSLKDRFSRVGLDESDSTSSEIGAAEELGGGAFVDDRGGAGGGPVRGAGWGSTTCLNRAEASSRHRLVDSVAAVFSVHRSASRLEKQVVFGAIVAKSSIARD